MRDTALDIYTLVGKNYLLLDIMEDTAPDNVLGLEIQMHQNVYTRNGRGH